MPTYEYLCEKCGNKFEVVQSMKDPKLEDCLGESCDGKMKRLIGGGAGLIFKGSGFYITDYRSESYKSGAKKEKESSSGGGEKKETKKEKKKADSAKPKPAAKKAD